MDPNTNVEDTNEDETFSDWEGDDDVDVEIHSLFNPKGFKSNSLIDVIDYDAYHHNFDLRDMAKKYCLDEVDLIKLINFIRTEVRSYYNGEDLEGTEGVEESKGEKKVEVIGSEFMGNLKYRISSDDFMGDEFLRPVMPDDPFLCMLHEIMEFDEDDDDEDEAEHAALKAAESAEELLQSQGVDVAAMGAKYRDLFSGSQAQEPQRKVLVPQPPTSAPPGVVAAPTTSASASTSNDASSSASTSGPVDEDTYYFDSYSHIGIHETMLRDTTRTLAYRDSLLRNSDGFVRGKVVIDVGCGSGILSMFAAKAGARHVIGIDNSSIIHQTRLIVADNGYSDTITLLHGKVEDLCAEKQPGGGSVLSALLAKHGIAVGRVPEDSGVIIVSEWMGYGLYFENMLSSVFHLRDYVRRGSTAPVAGSTGGVAEGAAMTGGEGNVCMFPHTAVLFIEGMTTPAVEQGNAASAPTLPPPPPTASTTTPTLRSTADRVDYWRDVYGFKMQRLVGQFTKEASVQDVECAETWCATDRVTAYSLNCGSANDAELDFSREFELHPKASFATQPYTLKAFVLSFDVIFDAPGVSNIITLSTTPAAPPGHWKQTICWLDPDNRVQNFSHENGDSIRGNLIYQRCHGKNKRDYTIVIQWNVVRGGGKAAATAADSSSKSYKYSQVFTLSAS